MTDTQSILSILKNNTSPNEYKNILQYINTTDSFTFNRSIYDELNNITDKLYINISNKNQKYFYKATYTNKLTFIGYFIFSDLKHIILLDQSGIIRLADAFPIDHSWNNTISLTEFKRYASQGYTNLIDITEYNKDN